MTPASPAPARPGAQELENLLMQPSPYSGARPDGEAAMHGRLRRSEARWQRSPGAAADQHVDDRGGHRLIVDSRPRRPPDAPAPTRQRPRQLPQAVRNDPTPPSTPHAQHAGNWPCRKGSGDAAREASAECDALSERRGGASPAPRHLCRTARRSAGTPRRAVRAARPTRASCPVRRSGPRRPPASGHSRGGRSCPHW